MAEHPSCDPVVARPTPADAGVDGVVPFTDLAAMAQEVWPLIDAPFMGALRTARYVGGPPVEAFEREWADYCGRPHAVGVGNGTDALLLTLQGLGIGAGDEVVVPANTFIATVEAVVRAGARPRFADVSDRTLLLTPQSLAEAITPATRVAVAVHLYGQTPDMDALQDVADDAGITLIEDAAQAHGARWRDRRAGSFGVAAAFSFYPGKNVGAFGDAGAVVTADPDLADRVRALANHGRRHGAQHHAHELLGTNSRLDTLQAIVLSGKLHLNDEWTRRRIALADRYRSLLSGSAAVPVETAADARHVYHLFVVRVRQRDRVRARLAERGIATGLHYPVPCHLQPPLRGYADGRLPVCEAAAGQILSLPMFPHLRQSQVDQVCEALLDVVRGEVLTDAS